MKNLLSSNDHGFVIKKLFQRGVVTLSICSTLISLTVPAISEAYQGMWEWKYRQGCYNCKLLVDIKNPEIDNKKVRLFVAALGSNKQSLMKLYSKQTDRGIFYQVTSDEYNMLAGIAFGILGNESKFYESYKFHLKETFPELVTTTKVIKSVFDETSKVSVNSRGPTQIKVIPQKIRDAYGISVDDLNEPDKAAIATMAFLIETHKYLKQMIVNHNLTYINNDNIADYLPYIYYGNGKALIAGTATPETNRYVQNLKKYLTWIDMFEREYESAR